MKHRVVSIIIGCVMLSILLSACQPKIPRTKSKSFDDMVKSLPFQIVFPEVNSNLYSDEYDVEYFLTYVPGFNKPIKTGYSIEVKAITHTQNDFWHMEYRGIDLTRENGRWTMFDERNYTCVKPETMYETQGQTMVYAEYRPYPFTTNEMLEHKGITQQPSNEISKQKDILFYPSFVDEVDESENEIFTIFHAYIDVGDLRYSITIYNVDECTTENIEIKCLEEAVLYFKELFTTKEAITDAP
jgi:hypothetical protein